MYQQKSLSFRGSDIAYYRDDTTSQKGVVFCHGDGHNHTAGLDLLALFPDTYAKIGLDRPGHGRSSALPGRTVRDECDILEKILDTEGIKEAILIGHSSGAAIATSLALRQRLAALVLVNPFFMNPREAFRQSNRLFRYAPIPFLEWATYLRKAKDRYDPSSQQHTFGDDATEEDIADAVFTHTPYDTLRQNLSLFEGYDVRGAAHSLSLPVLIVYATKGWTFMQDHVRQMSMTLPNARFMPVDGTHNVHLLSKEAVADTIKKNISFLCR